MARKPDAVSDAHAVTSNFLRRRFWVFGALLLVPVACAAVISIVSLRENLKSNNFSAAFSQLASAISRLESSIDLAKNDEIDAKHILHGHEAFVDLLGTFGALRASEVATTSTLNADPKYRALRFFLDGLNRDYGIDPLLQNRRLGLDEARMPDLLAALWDGRRSDGHAALDVQIGMILKHAAPAFAEGASNDAIVEAAVKVDGLAQSALNQQLAELRMALYDRTRSSATLPIYLVSVIALIVPACFMLAIFTILRPLERRVLTSQRALIAERENAKAAERAKSEFLATMSHEIRTPLNGVLGMAELLQSSKLDERQGMYAQIIVRSGRTLLGVINDILDFSKIDAGYLKIEDKPFKLSDVTYDPVHLVAPAAEEKGLELVLRTDPELPGMVVGDMGRLRQVVTNLVGNAIKFTDTGQIMVDVSGTVARNRPGGQTADLRVEVRDTGIGIPEEDLAGIFDKFTQVDGSSTRTREGTGLGLSIVKGLVELMGGRIGINSVLGLGTTVWFELSLPVAADTSDTPGRVIDVAGARILVIDDNETNRCILQEMLSAWRMQESSAASGAEGLRRLRSSVQHGRPFDLVILDHHMPGMNGEGVLRAIRSDPDLAKLGVILLTSIEGLGAGAGSEGGEDDCLNVDAYLVKPAPASQLFDTIATLLAERSSFAVSERAGDGEAPADGGHGAHGEQTGPGAGEAGADISGRTMAQDRQIGRGARIQAAPKAAGSASAAELAELGSAIRDDIRTASPDRCPEGHPSPGGDVLLVEDNEVNRMVAQHVLMGLDLSCEEAANGAIAVEKFAAFQPGIILMDVSMPTMNGYEATAKIREIESARGLKRTPIIGLTAHALQGDREKCLDAGMDDYLSKPISTDALREKIAALRETVTERRGNAA